MGRTPLTSYGPAPPRSWADNVTMPGPLRTQVRRSCSPCSRGAASAPRTSSSTLLEFLNLCQEPEEAVSKFISRVKGQAKVCEFTVTCPAEDCGQDVSYSDKLCTHVIVRGLEDSDIQERGHTLAANEANLDLKLTGPEGY